MKSPESFNKQPTKTLKFAFSIPDWVIGIFRWLNPSDDDDDNNNNNNNNEDDK